jgi:deoxyribonuclease-4
MYYFSQVSLVTFLQIQLFFLFLSCAIKHILDVEFLQFFFDFCKNSKTRACLHRTRTTDFFCFFILKHRKTQYESRGTEDKMNYIGAHVSIAGGLETAPLNAKEIGATAFAMFTKNQRQWISKPIEEEQALLFKETCNALGYTKSQILPHDSYLINLGNPDKTKREQSLEAFVDELGRVAQLGLDKLNFHPGSAVDKSDRQACLRLVANSLDEALQRVDSVLAVLETTAGQGSSVGSTFEEIETILEYCHHRERLGVCIDTCHIFTAGYDIRTREAFDNTMEHFSKTIGFENLKGMHLNDAKPALGSHVDRHASLGKGSIGIDCFSFICKDPRFSNIPLILETPDSSCYASEISLLKSYS